MKAALMLLVAFLAATGCAGDRSGSTALHRPRTNAVVIAGDDTLHLPSAPRRQLELPLRPPADSAGVAAKVSGCAIFATIQATRLGFAWNSYTMTSAGKAFLSNYLAEVLSNPQTLIGVEITGYASAEGDAAHNLELSRNRAAVTAAYIRMFVHGVPALEEGAGTTNPVGDNRTEEGRIRNRRVELLFQFEGCKADS